MVRINDTTSLSEHRDHLSDHLRQVRETGRPLFVTANGETEAVVLSPEAYDELANAAELARSYRMLEQSATDIAAGRVQPAKEAVDQIAQEFGLNLQRRPARG